MKYSVLLITLAAALLTAGKVHAQTSPLKVVEENGDRGKRLNMVFMSEGYTAAQMGSFASDVQKTVDYLFTKEPWVRYRSYFNIYRIEVASVEKGTDYIDADAYGTIYEARSRNTYFNTGFTTDAVPQLLTLSSSGSTKAYSLLNTHVPEYDIPIVLVNDLRYGGSGGPIAVATVEEFSVQVMEHELGHSFAKLTDEYDFAFPGYPATEYPNATAKTQPSQIRWNVWIEPDTPLPTPESEFYEYTDLVGLFEGANYRAEGWYRPHDNALMRSLGMPPGSVSREAIILNYYSKISPVDAFSPAPLKQTVTLRKPLTFSATPKVPSTGPELTVTWRKNGSQETIATGPEFTIPSQDLGNGAHTITAVITDPTTWVRRDPTALLAQTITWNLTLSNQGEPPIVDQAPEHAFKEVGEAVTFTVAATPVTAGALTYQWYKDGNAISKATATTYSISAVKLTDGGVYSVRVTGNSAYAEPSADLVVMDPQVQTLVLAKDKTATLIPAVAGPVQEYEWLHQDTVIPPNTPDITGLGTKKLVISPLNVTAHRGLYGIKLTTAAMTATYDTHLLDIFDRAPELILTPGDTLPPGRVGAFYSQPILIETDPPGGPASTFGATGLPPGLKADPKTGTIRGTPTAFKADKFGTPIPYTVTLSAGNGAGTRKVTGVNLLISPLPVGSVGSFVAPLMRHGPPDDPAPGLNESLGGRLDLVTAANGTYSGKLVLGTRTHSFKGPLTATVGSSTVSGATTIPRKDDTELHLAFIITADMRQINGTVSAEEEVELAFSGWLNPWNKSNLADELKGYHTFRLDLDEPPEATPTGRGFGSFTIASDGKTTISGRTADGEMFTSASHVGHNGELMIFSLQKGKPQGSIVGKFSVNGSQVLVGDPEDLTWWRRDSSDAKTRIYKDGFGPLAVQIVGGRYNEPLSPLVVLDIAAGTSNADLAFSGASLSGVSRPPGTSLDIAAKSKAKPSQPLAASTTITFNPKLGTFTGKFSLLDDNPRGVAPLQVPRAVTYQGIILKDGGSLTGDGFFLLPDLPLNGSTEIPTTTPIRSGAVKLTP